MTLVAMLTRPEVHDGGGQQVAVADLQRVAEVVAAKLAVAQRAVLAGDRAEERRLLLVGRHVARRDRQEVDVDVAVGGGGVAAGHGDRSPRG